MLQLYLQYERLLYATAGKYVSQPEEVKDIVQGSVAKLLQKVPLLRQKEPCVLAGYLTTVVRNTAISRLREQAGHSGRNRSLEEQEDDIPAPGPPPEEILLQAERKERLLRLWARLSQEDRLLLDYVAEAEGKQALEENAALQAEPGAAVPDGVRQACLREIRRAFRKKRACSGGRHALFDGLCRVPGIAGRSPQYAD